MVRRPQCPACGDVDLLKKRAERPVVLETRPKRFTEDGGYRCATPEETYARHAHLVSPITGVVTRVAPVEGRDHPLRPVFGAGFFVRATGELGPALGEGFDLRTAILISAALRVVGGLLLARWA